MHLKIALLNFYEESCSNFDEGYFEFIDSFWWESHSQNSNPKDPLLLFLHCFLFAWLKSSQDIMEAIVKDSVFQISFSICSSFLCRKTTYLVCSNFVT